MPNRIIHEAARTSESLNQLTDAGERMFWRLTTVADDFGRFNANITGLLALCFPLKVREISDKRGEVMLQELVTADLIQLYQVDGKRFGVFIHWQRFQQVRAKKSRYPDPPDINCDQLLADADGTIGAVIGTITDTDTDTDTDTHSSLSEEGESEGENDPLKPEDLVEAWNEQCKPLGLGEVRELSGARRQKLNTRIREHPDPDWWSSVLAKIKNSRFCRGDSPPRNGNGKPWRASFDWMIDNDTNALKALEGKYDG